MFQSPDTDETAAARRYPPVHTGIAASIPTCWLPIRPRPIPHPSSPTSPSGYRPPGRSPPPYWRQAWDISKTFASSPSLHPASCLIFAPHRLIYCSTLLDLEDRPLPLHSRPHKRSLPADPFSQQLRSLHQRRLNSFTALTIVASHRRSVPRGSRPGLPPPSPPTDTASLSLTLTLTSAP
jgi:hypothetical protein